MKNKIIVILLFVFIIAMIYFIYEKKDLNWQSYQTKEITLTESIKITKEGIYLLTGTITNGYIEINTEGTVKLILNNVSITNLEGPTILIKKAKKVEINTPKETINNLIDGNTYQSFDDINGCIYSYDNLVLSGAGKLVITANYANAVVSHDKLNIKSGNYTINAKKNALKANKQIEINGGNFNLDTTNDGIHSDSDLVINEGNFKINCTDDAIHADNMIEINGGTFDITGSEGIEANYVKINDGAFIINAVDDGINAGKKAGKYIPMVEINDGNIIIKTSNEDADGIDSNGDIYINGGLIDITAKIPFDYDGKAQYNGGAIIINGKKTNTIANK